MNKKEHFKSIFLLFLLTIILCTSLFADADLVEFDDSVFMVNETIKFGEEYFLERLGIVVEVTENGIVSITPEDSEAELPVALVLSGGAARAFAHVGVLKKFEQEGIFPDFIVANSMGSVVGLLYAAGVSPHIIERMIMEYPTEFLFTLKIPTDGGLIDDYNMISMFYQILGDLDISELEIPTVVLAEDLKSRRQVAFMEGDFYKILSATSAMPVSFSPVDYNGMVLIDGGTTNLVPVRSASNYTDKIIVSTAFANPDNEYRNIISVINRAVDIGKTRTGIEELKSIDNILIRCNVEDFSYMDFQKTDEIVQRGIHSAENALGEIKSRGFDKNSTWSKERIDRFMEKRAQITERYNEVLKDYKRTGIIKQKEFVGYLTAGAEMYSGTKDDYYLDNSDYIYFAQRGEIETIVGEIREYWDPWRGFGFDVRLNFSLFELLSFKNRVMLKWNNWNSGNLIEGFDGILYYGRVDCNITNDGVKGVNPFIAWEGFFSKDYGFYKGVESTFGRTGVDLYFGDYSITPYVFSETYPVAGMGIENNFKIKLFGSFYLDQRSVVRFPFNKRDRISLYENDGLRSYIPDGVFDYFIVTNNSLAFRTETFGSFGESIAVKSLALSAFCDYYKTDDHGVSAGFEFDVSIALIGLASFYVTSYVGYDFNHSAVFGSIAVGGNR